MSYREESRKNYGKWTTVSPGSLDSEQLKVGALLRIADALEKQNSDVETLRSRCLNAESESRRLSATNTRLRKELREVRKVKS